MPKDTRVYRCVQKIQGEYGYGAAIAICQKSADQSYRTGKSLKSAGRKGRKGGRFYKKKGRDGKMRKVYR